MKSITKVMLCALMASACTTTQKVVQVESQVETPVEAVETYTGLKRKVAIARFSNETQYAKGIFYEKENDPIAKQASDILSTKLASSDKFILLERQEFESIENEMNMAGNSAFQKVGADYIIVGSVTEFGRKNEGDVNAFSRSKTQTVEAAVVLRLIDVTTGQIMYSEEAKGEAQTSNKTVLGYGERTGYDATLSDKAISVAISKLVENVINNCMDRPWKAFFLSMEEDVILMSGGSSQNIKAGDTFQVELRGKRVENKQTGLMIELPGTPVAKVRVISTGGADPMNEYSMVEVTEGDLDPSKLENYLIKEI